MSASQVRPLILEDPAILWLEHHGAQYGFQPDEPPYSFLDFIAAKSRQFAEKWLQEMAPQAIRVCREASEVRDAEKVRQTYELMRQGAPVIAQPALWWAPERIYGAPDLIVHSAWLREKFPGLGEAAQGAGGAPQPGHYLVFELKFSTRLDSREKARNLAAYATQLRLYTYMLGQLQGSMPRRGYLIARDRVADPLPVEVQSTLAGQLDPDLAALRDQFVEIKVNGAQYSPWKDTIVAANPANADERWRSAKETIAREKVPGGDSALLYQVGAVAKRGLAEIGYPSLAALLDREPEAIPLEAIKGLGGKKAAQIRAILQANRSQSPVLPPSNLLPPRRPFEFYVDFEYFTNLNVDFERQWPDLEGCEMVFLIGVGWEQDAAWRFETLIAAGEDPRQEGELFGRFLQRLASLTGGAFSDPQRTALVHWTGAEPRQTQRAASKRSDRGLPWVDLQKVFLDGPAALPGALDYGLKSVAKALGEFDPQYQTQWPEGFDEGVQVMVMGWKAYLTADPLQTQEMRTLTGYLEADCQALWNILRWLRTHV
jgi:uncharacterized protein